jgi:predicted ATP-dependent endonuclease of OLD family
MKIKRIELKNFFQFKDVSIDLTYPKGHEKEGQPLEKVCIIGQSGTGKTSLLRLIKWFISRDRGIGEDLKLQVPKGGQISIDFLVGDIEYRLSNNGTDLEYSFFHRKSEVKKNGKRKPSFADCDKILSREIEKITPLLLNFPTELISQRSVRRKEEILELSPTMQKIKEMYYEDKSMEPVRTVEEGTKRSEQNAFRDKLEQGQVIDFAIEDVTKTWHLVLKDIREHRAQIVLNRINVAELLKHRDAAIQKKEKEKNKNEAWELDNPNVDPSKKQQKKDEREDTPDKGNVDFQKIQQEIDELEKWMSNNPDLLKRLAEQCLDPILIKLGLRVQLDINEESILNLGFVQLETLEGLGVPLEYWSTGTWQMIKTIMPLFLMKPANAVILVDEPERSLYPDFQTAIIDTYANLAIGSQFFFATHSPMIASCFEPWEIVELKFDEEYISVSQELQYEGENHVDHYKNYPQYMRWDSILQRIFDLEEEGNEERIKNLKDLTKMKVKIVKLKKDNQLDTKEGRELVDKYLELNRKLGWNAGSDEQ